MESIISSKEYGTALEDLKQEYNVHNSVENRHTQNDVKISFR